MKRKNTLSVLLLLWSLYGLSQSASVTWGDEFKLRVRDADLHVAWADNTGTYFIEEHLVLTSYFVIGTTSRESAGLVKLDKGLNEMYRASFDKELKKKRYQDILFSKKKMYLLASDFDKSSRTLALLVLELNKVNGEAQGDWKEVASIQLDTKRDDFKFKCVLTEDSTRFRMVTAQDGEKNVRYSIREFTEDFKPVFKPVEISHDIEPEKIELEDIITASNGNILFVARQLEYEDGKKEKKKNLAFQNYNMRLYNPQGGLIREINTEIEGRWLVNSKSVLLKNGEIGVAAFYSNAKKAKEIDGLMMMRVSSITGELSGYNSQPVSASMLTNEYDDSGDGDETKEEKAERKRFEKLSQDDDGINRSYKIRALTPTADGGMALVAEKFYTYILREYSESTRTWNTYLNYMSQDLLLAKFAGDGKINWMKLLPKKQQETVSTRQNVMPSDYFVSRFQFPFWGGVAVISLPGKNTLSILMNDHSRNEGVTRAGQKAKGMLNAQKSNAFLLNVDLASGEIRRKFIFAYDDTPAAMFRHGVLMGNIFYVVGKKAGPLGILSKPKIAVGKLTFK